MCSRPYSGAAVLSNDEYSTEGEFEFKIRPSLSEGVVTVVGLAKDLAESQDQYLQIVFDTQTYTNCSFALILGGSSYPFPDGTKSKQYMINLIDVFPSSNTRLLQEEQPITTNTTNATDTTPTSDVHNTTSVPTTTDQATNTNSTQNATNATEPITNDQNQTSPDVKNDTNTNQDTQGAPIRDVPATQQPIYLNDTDFLYVLKMSPKTGIVVKMSRDGGLTYKTAFTSESREEVKKFVTSAPQKVNVHVAAWENTNDLEQGVKNGS